nr:carboxypeptidase-like regulatory domain-containing protein [Saprospiraceae bacterium]
MVSIKNTILFWIGLLLFATNLSGQWTITGKVIDAESGEGLSYVNITFKDGATFNTTSDQNGAFRISGLTETHYQVVFSMIGFQTVLLDTVSASDDPLHISMHPESYLTKEVVV